jgi:hypothetical protein
MMSNLYAQVCEALPKSLIQAIFSQRTQNKTVFRNYLISKPQLVKTYFGGQRHYLCTKIRGEKLLDLDQTLPLPK